MIISFFNNCIFRLDYLKERYTAFAVFLLNLNRGYSYYEQNIYNYSLQKTDVISKNNT